MLLLFAKVVAFGFHDTHGANRGWLKEIAIGSQDKRAWSNLSSCFPTDFVQAPVWEIAENVALFIINDYIRAK